MQLVQTEQIKRIHTLLARLGRANDKEFKKDLVNTFSNLRVDSTKGLYYGEAKEMIDRLQMTVNQSQTPEQLICNQKRRRIIHFAHLMNWYKNGSTAQLLNGSIIGVPRQAQDDSMVVDMQRIDDWCVKYGQFHKALDDHDSAELSKIIVQFEKVYKDWLKAV